MMESFNTYFPALRNTTYLNTPASGLIPAPVTDWRIERETELLNYPDDFRNGTAEILNTARRKIAGFIHTDADNIGFVPNFSYGYNILLEGLPQNSKILVLEGDYPSITWPIEKRGYTVKYQPVVADLEENIQAAIEQFKPDAFILSIVQWASGIKIDTDFLRAIKTEHPSLLIIADGTQYLGTEHFDFEKSGLDVLISSAYKWMLAGFGNGFVAIKKQAETIFRLKTVGLNSAGTPDSGMSDILYMKHFEPGHLNAINFGSITKAIEFTEQLGHDKLYKHIESLSNSAKNKLGDLGVLSKIAVNRKPISSIFNIRADETTFARLINENISCSWRAGGIRVGFHFYNTEEDLNRLISVLKK